jgi:hypothetical protein
LFMSAGPIAAADIQQRIVSEVLSRRTGAAIRRQPALAPAWTGPREQQLRIPSQRGRADEHGMQIAWSSREKGGAYGGYARHGSDVGVFSLSSYRIRCVVRTWLSPDSASRAGFVGNAAQGLAGLDLVDLTGLALQSEMSTFFTGSDNAFR